MAKLLIRVKEMKRNEGKSNEICKQLGKEKQTRKKNKERKKEIN